MCYDLQFTHGRMLFNILQRITLAHEYPEILGTCAAGKDVSCLVFCIIVC
jgi:hypothetical protein